jgi:16S rRNA (cytosine967-C5)-methyltransferase
MSCSGTQSPRRIAAEITRQYNPEKDYITLILDEKIERTSQKQTVTDLVFGSLRHITAIDTVLEFFAKRRINHISTPLLSIIRIALYELIYCPDTPDYAIINDAVENTKSIAGKKQTAFVNAVLRQTARRITNRCITMNSLTAKNLLPQNMQTGCRFDSDFLPDASVDLPEYLHVCHSLPKWLISDWLGQFGKEKTQQICFASNRRPSVYLRPNTIKIQPKALLEKLQDQQICCELVCLDKKTYPKPTMIRLKSPQRIAELPGYAEGLFMIQDITASRVVTALAPGPGWRILDLCSAPGTKTAQIAEMTNDKAVIEATDINSERLKKVS